MAESRVRRSFSGNLAQLVLLVILDVLDELDEGRHQLHLLALLGAEPQQVHQILAEVVVHVDGVRAG